MSYPASKLITNSYYLSGVVARDLQSVSGAQGSDGLDMLNALLAFKTANQKLIPYYTKYSFNAVIGQESYFVPNLVAPETLTFNIGPVRYSSQPTPRKIYFGSGRVDNITSLPFNWHAERCFGGSNVYLYFVPDNTYPCIIWGRFSLPAVTMNQDLSLTMDPFYIEYLRYALAEYIAQENTVSFPAESRMRLKELEEMIQDISPPDLTATKTSSLSSGPTMSWAQVSLGKGWSPS
jgi:hypothetical protein